MKSMCLEPVLHKRSHQDEKPVLHERSHQDEKPMRHEKEEPPLAERN